MGRAIGVEPFYPEAGNGRQPVGLVIMLRTYFLQQWFGLWVTEDRCGPLPDVDAHKFTVRQLQEMRRRLDRSWPKGIRLSCAHGSRITEVVRM